MKRKRIKKHINSEKKYIYVVMKRYSEFTRAGTSIWNVFNLCFH